MIKQLFVAVPKNTIDRNELPFKSEIKRFETLTGIKKTRRFEGDCTDFIMAGCFEFKQRIERKEIEQVILVTQTPDRTSPCTALDVQRILSLKANIPVFDINQSCPGFVYGLHACAPFMKTLLVCVDRIRYDKTPLEGLMFSDAISFAIVQPMPEHKTNFRFFSDPTKVMSLYQKINGEMEMDGGAVYDLATQTVPGVIKKFHEQTNERSQYLCLHQANKSIMQMIQKRAGFTEEQNLFSIEEYGNQSMNSIPTALVHNRNKILGNHIMLCGYGAGFSVAATVTYFDLEAKDAEIVEV